MYEPTTLCASCADDYRLAGFKIVANVADKEKGICELCAAPWGMAYFILRNPDITVIRCIKCGAVMTKTQTLDAVYYSCRCGHEEKTQT